MSRAPLAILEVKTRVPRSESEKRFVVLARIHIKQELAGWSSPVARKAHNLEVMRSNRIPATNHKAIRINRMAFVVIGCSTLHTLNTEKAKCRNPRKDQGQPKQGKREGNQINQYV